MSSFKQNIFIYNSNLKHFTLQHQVIYYVIWICFTKQIYLLNVKQIIFQCPLTDECWILWNNIHIWSKQRMYYNEKNIFFCLQHFSKIISEDICTSISEWHLMWWSGDFKLEMTHHCRKHANFIWLQIKSTIRNQLIITLIIFEA